MDKNVTFAQKNIALLSGRILLSLLFLFSGVLKFMMGPQMAGMLGQVGLPAPHLMVYLIGLCEVVGGLALVAGYQTRTVAVLLAIWCVATGFVAHMGDPLTLLKNIGLAGGFIILAATTPGSLALDWRRRGALASQN
ncbi:MAG: DoxX family protein [Sphingobium sp.]|nr:DoxX family protein [Sphingobium sp.]